MLLIDGGYGEGGGQIIRSAIAFSCITSTPVKLINIRAKRRNPGLRPQHVACVSSVGQLCDAVVADCSEGSDSFTFIPGEINGGCYDILIGTAGSVTLVIQSLLPLALKISEDIKLRISGGTDVKWSPPIDYLQNVTLELLRRNGLDARLNVLKRGYYPKGGGLVEFVMGPSDMGEIILDTLGDITSVNGLSHAHIGLKDRNVCERQADAVRKLLSDYDVDIVDEYVETSSFGSGVTLWAGAGSTILGADQLGEKGVRSEDVGGSAAKRLLDTISSGVVVDEHMEDQLIPFLALCGGSIRAEKISSHTSTNIWIANQFGFNVVYENGFIKG